MGRNSDHQCAFCHKSFGDQVKLVVHFHRRHVKGKLTPQEEAKLLSEDMEGDEEDKEEGEEMEGQEEEQVEEKEFISLKEQQSQLSKLPLSVEDLLKVGLEDLVNEGEKEDVPNEEEKEGMIDPDPDYLAKLNEEVCTSLLCAGPFLVTPKKKKKKKDESESVVAQMRRLYPKGRRCEYKEKTECVFCGKVFKYWSKFEEHVRIHTGEKPYSCEWCDESFSRQNYLTKHTRKHTEPERYPCPCCSEYFTEVYHLKNHLRVSHAGMKPYRCTEAECGKAFANQNKLDRHMLAHSAEKVYECEHCGKAYPRLDTLNRHIKSIHFPDLDFQCKICDEKFATELLQKKHSELIHGSDATMRLLETEVLDETRVTCLPPTRFMCRLCDHGYSTLEILKIHKEMYHSYEASFSCGHEGCSSKFFTEEAYQIHTEMMHPTNL